jgi:hypothetical protein
MSTRAMMSASETLLFALGAWTDSKLQPFSIRQRAYFKSIQVLKTQLNDVVVPPNSFLFTADTVSMYTNIPTDQALSLICNHIRATAHLIPDVPVEALCSALRIVMRCNIFSFGDTFWRQISGTAMGCPPAPHWANTFFGLFEAIFLPIFQDNLSLYKRFIDDVNGIWTTHNPATNDEIWEQFKSALKNEASTLEWIVSPLSQVADFIDMTLSSNTTKSPPHYMRSYPNTISTSLHTRATLQVYSEAWSMAWSIASIHLYQTKLIEMLEPSAPSATSKDAATNHGKFILSSPVPSPKPKTGLQTRRPPS